jgi:hypothetical protein
LAESLQKVDFFVAFFQEYVRFLVREPQEWEVMCWGVVIWRRVGGDEEVGDWLRKWAVMGFKSLGLERRALPP